MAILSTQTIESINESDLNQVPSKLLRRSFGQGNDSIELSIFDPQGKLLIKDSSFREFKSYITPGGIAGKSKVTSIDIDYEQVLRDYGYNNGTYVMNFSFQRQITSIGTPFSISEISPSRTELRIVPNNIPQADFELDIINLNSVIKESAYIKDINLSFAKDTALAVNIVLDKNKTGLVKLYNPLPFNINTGESFKIFEEIINPIEVTIELTSEGGIQELTGIDIGAPNFNISNEDIFTVPSGYKTFDQILTNGAASSSFNNIQNILNEGNIQLDLEFDNVDTPSGYHFENFIHFSSATERLQNFKYKLGLLQTYSSSLANLNNITGSISSSNFITENRTIIQGKENKLLQSFDYYERYLYYEKGPYAWPKTNDTLPYINAKTESAAAVSWFGAPVNDYSNEYYGGQMLSASKFDDYNTYNLVNTIPPHIQDNTQNDKYVLFVEMIAQHFDGIWAYMDSITDINEAYSGLKDGISKDLVLNQLTSRGISAYDQFSNSSLYEYLIGDDGTGTFEFNTSDNATIVSASNAPIPKGDIAKEIWKRLYHNSSYLLKTKGTERGLKALIACYGIPETVLHVKEYGGPLVDKTGFRTFSYQKESQMATHKRNLLVPILYDDSNNSFSKTKTLQVRYKAPSDPRHAGFHKNRTGFDIITFNGAQTDISIGVTQSIDPTLVNSQSFAHLIIMSGSNTNPVTIAATNTSSLGPILNGDVWNISVVAESGSYGAGEPIRNTLTAYATNTTPNKNTYILSCSLVITDEWSHAKAIGNGAQKGGGGFGTMLGSFTGSLQEYRSWNETLTLDTIVTQSLSPFNYNGNTISSSYETLHVRVPLGSDNKGFPTTTYISSHSNHIPNLNLANRNLITYGAVIKPSSLEETHHLTTPDTVGSGMVSDKVRIDNGTFDDNFLDPFISVETSPQDRQPLDYSDLGVFLSPTFEINEDIIYTLGGFRLDDYIGDPEHFTLDNYPDLKTIRDIYTKKLDKKLGIGDYIRTIQFFDHTLFKMIKEFVPAKANLKTGLVIEPHYLERTKIGGTNVDYEQINEHLAEYSPSGSISSTNETVYDVFIDVVDYIDDGSYSTAVENVAQVGVKSKYYYK
jgi:hypothetical protein